MLVAVVNIIGPDGRFIQAGAEIPNDTDPKFVDELIKSGGAKREKKEEETTDEPG